VNIATDITERGFPHSHCFVISAKIIVNSFRVH